MHKIVCKYNLDSRVNYTIWSGEAMTRSLILAADFVHVSREGEAEEWPRRWTKEGRRILFYNACRLDKYFRRYLRQLILVHISTLPNWKCLAYFLVWKFKISSPNIQVTPACCPSVAPREFKWPWWVSGLLSECRGRDWGRDMNLSKMFSK